MASKGGGQILHIAESAIGPRRCELRLEGELDIWSAARLQAALRRVAEANDAVVVGLDGCDFVDSSGIALFLQAHRQLQDSGGRLVLYGCSERVLRIFMVAGLVDSGLIYETRAAALAELNDG
jgi:anti-sigma B factor antagonist